MGSTVRERALREVQKGRKKEEVNPELTRVSESDAVPLSIPSSSPLSLRWTCSSHSRLDSKCTLIISNLYFTAHQDMPLPLALRMLHGLPQMHHRHINKSRRLLHQFQLVPCHAIDSTAAAPRRRLDHTQFQRRTFLSKISRFFRVIFGANETSPRGIQERQDSYWLLLSLQCRSLRLEHQKSIGNKIGWKRESKEEVMSFMDQAADALDQDEVGIHDLSLAKLRMEVQKRIEGQVLDRLCLASLVEEEFGAGDEYEFDETRVDEYKDILSKDYEDACAKLQKWEADKQENDGMVASRGEFYKLKKASIARLLDYYKWWPQENANEKGDSDLPGDQVDEFGFCQNKSSSDVIPAMRYHHTKNAIRSYYARNNNVVQNQQFSILPFRSTISNAGRGVFIDGYGPAGTLLAFFPGKVWPKDFLVTATLQVQRNLENDPRHQLSMRYDDVLIDSRKSPYTVYENMWALAHIVNHPPAPPISDEGSDSSIKQLRYGPNCVTCPINFTKEMLQQHQDRDLPRYIPNEYEVEPKSWAKNAFDTNDVVMNGMGLVALRDVHDEELFYDYRLSPASGASMYPEWYHVWNEDATNNRWSSEDN
jgi:hypothetical protein